MSLGSQRFAELEAAFRERFRCDEYFEVYADGYWSEAEQLWLVRPWGQVAEDIARAAPSSFTEYFPVGDAGVDGISFGYRAGAPQIWAYFSIANEFDVVAESLRALVNGWIEGKIKV